MFTPSVSLWAFLSQVMDDDQYQQAAVSRVIATTIAQGEAPPSSNTSAYSQARSRLSEEGLKAITRSLKLPRKISHLMSRRASYV